MQVLNKTHKNNALDNNLRPKGRSTAYILILKAYRPNTLKLK